MLKQSLTKKGCFSSEDNSLQALAIFLTLSDQSMRQISKCSSKIQSKYIFFSPLKYVFLIIFTYSIGYIEFLVFFSFLFLIHIMYPHNFFLKYVFHIYTELIYNNRTNVVPGYCCLNSGWRRLQYSTAEMVALSPRSSSHSHFNMLRRLEVDPPPSSSVATCCQGGWSPPIPLQTRTTQISSLFQVQYPNPYQCNTRSTYYKHIHSF